jgi:hypothetical protein
MRGRGHVSVASAVLLSVLLAGAPAARAAGDPIMPLSEVRQGMKCTGYSVIRGTEPSAFDVEVLDIVGGDEGARILVKVSGPAVDETGVGAGFSGSPIYCPAQDGQSKNAGAISETIGDYGGKTVLATPIEAILATPVDAPTARPDALASRARTSQAFGDGSRARWDPDLIRDATPLASPITIRGVRRDIFNGLATAARKAGINLIQAPPLAQKAQAAPPQPFKPGSTVGVGLSSGAISVGAVGTIAYVDGPDVWAFGHAFDGTGQRSLLLQDGYVSAIINNPVQLPDVGGTYKLAGAVNDVGTLTDDGLNAVAGRTGALPATIPVHVYAEDADTGRKSTLAVRVADETDVNNPSGASALAFVAPLALTQGATAILDSTPTRIAGEVCARFTFRERARPVRVCNRYVADGTNGGGSVAGNIVALNAANDLAEMISLIDAYTPSSLHVTDLGVRVRMTRGQHQAYMRKLVLPARVRPGQRVPAKLVVRLVRGGNRTIRFKLRIPSGTRRGLRQIQLRGANPDGADDLFGELTITLGDDQSDSDTEGPRSLKALVRAIRDQHRYDGLTIGRRSGPRAYRDKDLRIGGRVSTFVSVKR